jgi:hypothetical protein
MSKLIEPAGWVYVLVQNPGGNEQFVGQQDSETNVSFIPVWQDKNKATQCMNGLALDQSQKYEVQAISFEDLQKHARENGFVLFILDGSGKILEKVA